MLRLEARHPNNINFVFIIVEGKSDIKLYRKLFDDTKCIITSVPGGNPRVVDCVQVLLGLNQLVLGVRDSDFNQCYGEVEPTRNIFMTDYHDIEMTLVNADSVLSAVLSEYIDEALDAQLVRQAIMEIIHQISILKLFNFEQSKGLNFCCGFQDLIQFSTMTFNFDEYLKRVLAVTEGKPELGNLEHSMQSLIRQNYDFLQLTNGHDFMKALSSFINHKSGLTISSDSLESTFRITYRKELFQTTKLFTSLQLWGSSKNVEFN